MKSRLDYNLEIVDLIKQYLEKYPDQRFNQALVNLDIAITKHNAFVENNTWHPPLNIVDYHEESSRTLQRMLGETLDS